MRNVLKNQPTGPERDRLDEIEAIARSTETLSRTWVWLRNLSGYTATRPLAAILYPSTMASAAALVFQLEQAAIDWHLLEAKRQGRKFSKGGSRVAISLRLLDERLIFDGDRVRVHTGYSISALAHAAADRGLAGLEVFASLRGHLGAALVRSFDGEIWRLVEEIVVAGNGALKVILTRGWTLNLEQHEIVTSGLIVGATLKLIRGDARAIAREMMRLHRGAVAARTPVNPMLGTEHRNGAHRVNPAGRVTAALERGDRQESTRQLEFFDLEYDVDVWRDESHEV